MTWEEKHSVITVNEIFFQVAADKKRQWNVGLSDIMQHVFFFRCDRVSSGYVSVSCEWTDEPVCVCLYVCFQRSCIMTRLTMPLTPTVVSHFLSSPPTPPPPLPHSNTARKLTMLAQWRQVITDLSLTLRHTFNLLTSLYKNSPCGFRWRS